MKGWVLDCPEDFPSPLIGPKSAHRQFFPESSPLIRSVGMPSHSEDETVLVGPTGSLPERLRPTSDSSELRQTVAGKAIASLGKGPVAESNSAVLQALISSAHLGERAVFDEIRRLYSKDVPVKSTPMPGLRMSASEFDGTFAKPQK